MRWFFIILFFTVAIAAGTATFWWKPMMPLLGHPPTNLEKLSTYIPAVAALLGVVAAFAGRFFKEKESPKEETKPTLQSSVVKGNVVAECSDIAGRDNSEEIGKELSDPFSPFGDNDKTILRPSPGGRRRKSDEVHLAVLAPRFVKPDTGFVARFAAYIQELETEVRRKMEAVDRGHSVFIPQPETCRWQLGAPVRVRFTGDWFTAIPREQTFEWNGCEAIRSFHVQAKPDAPIGPAQFGFEILVADFSEAWLWVEVEITKESKQPEQIRTIGKPARRAFASYASDDLADVLARISAIAAWDKGLDIFYSWLDMVEGEDWETRLEKELDLREVLLLFWSRNAKASKWVEWEWKSMLRNKGIGAIQPIPIEPPEIASPPEELAAFINFRDRYLGSVDTTFACCEG